MRTHIRFYMIINFICFARNKESEREGRNEQGGSDKAIVQVKKGKAMIGLLRFHTSEYLMWLDLINLCHILSIIN